MAENPQHPRRQRPIREELLPAPGASAGRGRARRRRVREFLRTTPPAAAAAGSGARHQRRLLRLQSGDHDDAGEFRRPPTSAVRPGSTPGPASSACAVAGPPRDLAELAGSPRRASVEIVVGNHDVELLAPEVAAELMRQLAEAGAGARALERITVVPWFVYLPGVAWIEHGHIYDEGCSFEFNLAPMDPKDGNLIFNADYAPFVPRHPSPTRSHGMSRGALGSCSTRWGRASPRGRL